MENTRKSIEQMSIYHPYACLDEESFITIRHVKNQKEVRLSRSMGNVNLTDFWFSMLDSLATNNKSCSCQNIGLLSDVSIEEETNWWDGQDGNRICIGFLKIASNSRMSVKYVMEKLAKIIEGKGKTFRTLDNADIIIALSVEQTNKALLQKLVDEIIGYEEEGKSIYFSRFFVYGTGEKQGDILRIKNLVIAEGKERYCRKHSRYDQGWCDKLISKMVKHINEYKKQKNKKMMSYYQALLQILNVLGQYEQKTLHKDLFYIFYPMISTFISQLAESQSEVNSITEKISEVPYDDKQKLVRERQMMNVEIEESISQFLDTMELLMHHIGQSCEEIIGDTGHGGMPYDIPLRISLMYVSFLNVLTDVLVEEEVQDEKKAQRKEFAYCLSPLAYAQPSTMEFNIGNTEKSRLIRVKMPRHMLFMPRSFLVILAHEASHYAHETSRKRSERAKCMRKIIEFVMSVILVPNSIREEFDESRTEEYQALQHYINNLSCNIQEYLEKTIYNAIELEDNLNAQKYYLDFFVEKLHDVCLKVFYDENHDLERCVSGIDDVTVNTIRNVKKFPELYEKITRIQKKILNNAEHAAFDEGLHRFIDNLKRIFREIYADFSAIRLLDLSWEDYLEAYIISESCLLDWDDFPPETLNRLAMVKYVLEKKDTKGWVAKEEQNPDEVKYGWHNIQEMKKPIEEYVEKIKAAVKNCEENGVKSKKDCEVDSAIENDWLYCNEILTWEVEFFTECDESLKQYMQKREKKDEIAKLRNLYKSFEVRSQNNDGSFAEFFNAFDELTDAYKKVVDEKYRKDLSELAVVLA